MFTDHEVFAGRGGEKGAGSHHEEAEILSEEAVGSRAVVSTEMPVDEIATKAIQLSTHQNEDSTSLSNFLMAMIDGARGRADGQPTLRDSLFMMVEILEEMIRQGSGEVVLHLVFKQNLVREVYKLHGENLNEHRQFGNERSLRVLDNNRYLFEFLDSFYFREYEMGNIGGDLVTKLTQPDSLISSVFLAIHKNHHINLETIKTFFDTKVHYGWLNGEDVGPSRQNAEKALVDALNEDLFALSRRIKQSSDAKIVEAMERILEERPLGLTPSMQAPAFEFSDGQLAKIVNAVEERIARRLEALQMRTPQPEQAGGVHEEALGAVKQMLEGFADQIDKKIENLERNVAETLVSREMGSAHVPDIPGADVLGSITEMITHSASMVNETVEKSFNAMGEELKAVGAALESRDDGQWQQEIGRRLATLDGSVKKDVIEQFGKIAVDIERLREMVESEVVESSKIRETYYAQREG